jgi:hypothetical protein
LTLGCALSAQIVIPRKQVHAFDASLALVASLITILFVLDSHCHSALLFQPFALQSWASITSSATFVNSWVTRHAQIASRLYRQLLTQHGIQPSMSRKGNCWDNAVAESFFHTLKTEVIYLEDFDTREQAQTAVFEYIEVFYNRQRCHSANGYLAPLAYEQVLKTSGILCPEKC